MRRPSAWLLFGALTALALAATVDALRDRVPDPARDERPTSTRVDESTTSDVAQRRTAAESLREQGVAGLLYLTQRRPEGCRFLGLRLPDLAAQADVITPLCRLTPGPEGRVALWNSCPRTPIEVLNRNGTLVGGSVDGCAPAWNPRGELTFVTRGDVVVLDDFGSRCRFGENRCARVVLSGARIRRELVAARLLGPASRHEIAELAWVGPRRLAMIVRRRGDFNMDFVAIFTGRRALPSERPSPERLSHLRYVEFGAAGHLRASVVGKPGSGFFSWSTSGEFLGYYDDDVFQADRAFALSLDRRWVAVASSDSVYVLALNTAKPFDPVRLPLRVADVGWGGAD